MAVNDNDRAALLMVDAICRDKFILQTIHIRGHEINQFREIRFWNHTLHEIENRLHVRWQILANWVKGYDILEVFDLYIVGRNFDLTTERNDEGMLTIIRNLFKYSLENIINHEENKQKLVKLTLLMDLWYIGEDVTYYATALGME